MFYKKICNFARYCHTKSSSQRNFRDEWKSAIGLEIHAQLSTESKLFSSAPATFGAPTNNAVALFDAAIPGTLPSLNKKAVELAVSTALALGCKINPISHFDRKHYFYSDLPAGYQITQQRLPIAENGKLEYAIYQPGVHKKPYYKTTSIKQIQLEQDSGKSLHESSRKQCYIDLNRAGIALVEIIFQPDIENEYEACFLVKEVIQILERVKSCSCKMEEGALRVDANVSVSRGGSELGVRTEIKNLGSISGISNAIRYEVNRQVEILSKGGIVKNETLAWDSDLKKTIPVRKKGEKQDYRFMPETNLPPLRLLVDEYSDRVHKGVKSKNHIYDLRHLRKRNLELPQDDRTLLIEKYTLNDVSAFNLVNQSKLFVYFKEIVGEISVRDPQITYFLLMYHLLNALKLKNIELDDCFISSSHLGQVVDLLQKRRINKATVDHVLEQLLNKGNALSPNELVDKNNLYMISSTKDLKKICLRVMEKEPVAVAVYKRKKKKSVFNDLLSKAIVESKNRADNKVLSKVFLELLEEMSED